MTHDVYFNFTKVALIDSFVTQLKSIHHFFYTIGYWYINVYVPVKTEWIFRINLHTEMAHPLFHLKYNFGLFWFVSGITGHFVKFQSKSKIWLVQMHNVVFCLLRKKNFAQRSWSWPNRRERNEKNINVRVLGREELEN